MVGSLPRRRFLDVTQQKTAARETIWWGASIQTTVKLCGSEELYLHSLNPSSPNSDQHQFSPNNIHMLPRGMVMRVNKMVTKEKML